MLKIGIICGSLRKQSYNQLIANVIPTIDKNSEYMHITIGDLPLFNEDLEENGDPAAVRKFKDSIANVDSLLIVTPEYNASVPGVLKNAIDWASRPARNSPLHLKPIGIIGATPGGMGTAYSQLHLRQILDKTESNVMPFHKIMISQVQNKVDLETIQIIDDKTIQYLYKYLGNFIEWTNFINKKD